MKRRDFLLFTLSGIALAACGSRQKLSALPRGSRVLAFGDSVTYGTGAGPGEDWPTLLSELTGWQIINAGVSGDTAEAGKSRLPSLLDEHKPALVIIEIGGNDFLRRRSASDVKQDLKTMVAAVRSANAQPLLIGVPEMSLLAAFGKPGDSPIYAEISKEDKVPLIPNVFSDILSRPELCADKVHPNAAGYRRMADNIRAALKESGLTR